LGDLQVQPYLRKTKTNYIAVVPGAFNPPHIGHLETIRHTFLASGQDYSFVATIVILKTDSYLVEKNQGSGRRLHLTQEQRSILWRRHTGFPAWAAVYKEKTLEDFNEFKSRLTTATAKDGFEVKFVQVSGPDGFGPNQSPVPGGGFCDTVVISDAARDAWWFFSTRPLGLEGFSAWVKIHDGELDQEPKAGQVGRFVALGVQQY
jgi:hypothetical protein